VCVRAYQALLLSEPCGKGLGGTNSARGGSITSLSLAKGSGITKLISILWNMNFGLLFEGNHPFSRKEFSLTPGRQIFLHFIQGSQNMMNTSFLLDAVAFN